MSLRAYRARVSRMLEDLSADARMRLMKFFCSFAWADLEVNADERKFVADLIRRLDLDDNEKTRVEGWLVSHPGPESVDPTTIPVADREVFLEAIQGLVEADGEIQEEEAETLAIFRQLIA